MQTAMTEGLIGVIVPVYKVEKYIAECIESILAQTYTNFRLILVDDGSTDSSPLICDRLSSTDSRFRTIHKSNGGVSSARNAGIALAQGEEYISRMFFRLLIPAIVGGVIRQRRQHSRLSILTELKMIRTNLPVQV